MGSMDEEFQLLPTPQQNGVNLTCKTSKSFSEIWLNSPTDGVRAERKFSSSENAAGDREFAQQVSTEEKGPCETALTPKGLWSDSESVNTTSLPGSGHITTTAATVTTSTPPLLPSPSLSKVDEVLCDSSGSYHTAVCSVTLDNLSDSSGPFEGIEDLPTDSAAESDRAVGLSDINPGSERGPLNIPELGGSFPQCPPGPQCGLPEGDGEGFDDTWERKLCGGAGEWKPCGWNREMESCNSDGGNELRLDSGREEERGTADGNHSSGCEAAPGWLEGGDIGFVDVASDSCSLSVSSNSSGLAAINGTSTKHDPRVGNRRGKESRDQQVQLPISPGNSQTGKGCGGAGDQSLERNPLEQADFHPHPGPQTPQEMSRGDLASEDRRKSYHRTRCERAPPYCVSETSSVDETDREVRRLTSLAFRSLSCPGNGYFDISDCRSSAGLSPSLSEEGNNDTDMWSTYRESGHCPIDSENAGWSYSPSDTARFTSSPESGERNKDMSDDAFDRTQFECVDVMMESQEGKGGKTASRTVPKRQIQLKKRERNKLEVFPPRGDADCPADLGVRPEHANEEMVGRSGNVRDSSTATESARGGAARGKEENNNHKRLPRASCTGDSVTRSKQASCLITNVILKKMQFERGLKMKPGAGRDSIFTNVKDSEFCDDASKRVQRQDSSSPSETRVVAENLPDNHGNKSPDVKGIPTTKDIRSTREANPFSDEQSGNDICREKGELRNWKESSQDGQNDRTSGRDPDPTRQRLCPALIPSGSVPAEQEEDNDKLPASQGKRVDCFAQRTNRTLETSQSVQSKKLLCYQKTSRVLLSKRKVSDITFTSKSPGIILAPQLVNEKQTDGKSLGSVSKAQTLPTLWRTGAEEKQDKLPQSDTGERFSAEGKTKGPIIHHVRDVQKLVRDQRDVLTFTTHESELSEPKSVSLAPSLNHSSHSNQSEPAMRSRALPPIVIECRSISRKTNKDNDTCLSVAEKYWARVEGKHSSKVFSSDLKLPIPSDKHEKRQISICAAISLSRCVTGNKDLAHFSGAKNSERRIQALSISSNSGLESSFTKKRRERNCHHGEEDENTDPASHELTKETTELRPGKEKQSGLDLLNPVLAKSGATDQDASSFGKVEPSVEFESQLGNQNQKGSTVSSPTEGSSQIISCEGEERREGLRNRQIPSLPSENSTSTAGTVNCSQANDERPKASERKVETEDKPSRISCLENSNVETSNGKSIPQSAIEIESENPDELLSKSVIEQTSTSPQSDKGIEVITESKSKPFGNLSSNDKETQTSAWKRRHQGDVTVRPEIPRNDVEDGTCDGDDGRALSHTEQEKTEHGVRLEDGNRFLEKSTPNRSNGNLPSIGKAEAERPIVFALDDGSEPGACSVLSSGNVNTSSRIDERETEESSDLHNETLPLGICGSTCEEIKPLSEKNKGNGMAGANYLLGNAVSTEAGDIKDESEMQAGLSDEDKLDHHCVGNRGSLAKSEGKEDAIEPIAQTGQGENEKTQSPVNSGVRFISEFQPVKDTCGVSVISGEGGEQSPRWSEWSAMGIEGNPLSPEPNPFPSDPVDSRCSGRQTPPTRESPSFEESAENVASPQAIDAKMLPDRSVLSPGVQRSAGKAPGTLSPSTGYHGNSHPPGNQGVEFLTGKNPDQDRHPSFEAKSTREASAQCEAPFSSNAVNYLTIPVQLPPPPSPFVPSIPNSPQFQHAWETPLPHKMGSQTFPLHFFPKHQPLVAFSQHCCFASPQPSDPVWPPQSVPFLPPPRSLDVMEKCPELPLSPVVEHHHPPFPFSPVQNKMLVDPETGKYYLVQASVQSPRKMLLDPETGQYIEVIIPQQSYYQAPFSPYVLSPEVLRPPYMPGLQYPAMSMASPVVSPEQKPPREAGICVGEYPNQSHKYDGQKNQLSESDCMESLYYLPTGVTANTSPTQASLQLVSMHSTHSKSHVKVTEESTLILSSQQSQGLSTLASRGRPTNFAVEQKQK